MADLPSVSNELDQGKWRIGDTNYLHSLGYRDIGSADATYRLNGKYKSFTATFVLDESAIKEENASLVIQLDDQESQEFRTSTFHPAKISIDVANVELLTIKMRMNTNWGTLAVLGSARLSP